VSHCGLICIFLSDACDIEFFLCIVHFACLILTNIC
jgi:hypothetical protein